MDKSYNQGQKLLDRHSLFSFIHPFTALTLIFLPIFRWNCYPQFLYPNAIPPSHPLFQCCTQRGVCASTMWINIENGERGKSLVITPQWSNTFGPDCSPVVANARTECEYHAILATLCIRIEQY